MVSETNHYARNAKFISIVFILYYYLDLRFVENVIRFGPLSYSIGNLSRLEVVSFFCLAYFAFRFHASNNEKMLDIFLRISSEVCSKYTRISPLLNFITIKYCHNHFESKDVSDYKIKVGKILSLQEIPEVYKFCMPEIDGGGYDNKKASKGLYVDYSVEPEVTSSIAIPDYKGRAKAGFLIGLLVYTSAFILFIKEDAFWDVLLTYVLLFVAILLLLWNI